MVNITPAFMLNRKRKRIPSPHLQIRPKIVGTDKPKKAKATKTKEEVTSESDEALVHSYRKAGKSTISLTTFVANLRNPETGEIVAVNALADSGADHTILSARAARGLGLWKEGEGSNYFVKGHGGEQGLLSGAKAVVRFVRRKWGFVKVLAVC